MKLFYYLFRLLGKLNLLIILVYAFLWAPYIVDKVPIAVNDNFYTEEYEKGTVLYYKTVDSKELLDKGESVVFCDDYGHYRIQKIFEIQDDVILLTDGSGFTETTFKNINGILQDFSIPYVGYGFDLLNSMKALFVVLVLIIVLDYSLSNNYSIGASN